VKVRRELESSLAGSSGHARPVILFLGSFNSLLFRKLNGLLKAMRLPNAYSAFAIGAPGAGTAENEVEWVVGGGSYDPEVELDNAIDSRALFVGIGKGQVSCGSAKIVTSDNDPQEKFRRLAEAAFLIFIMPSSSATPWELSLILQSPNLREKSVFIMPGQASAKSWALLAEQYAAAGSAKLPSYDANGCYFRLNSDGRPHRTAGLVAFTRGLRNYLDANPDHAAPDATALWKAVEEFQDKNPFLAFVASPQSAADWARRVAATEYIDDAEALIAQLGGSVGRETTGTRRVTVKLFDGERSFEREQDMVQWVIRDVAPRTLSGHSDARH
jgi:hypothetical protein